MSAECPKLKASREQVGDPFPWPLRVSLRRKISFCLWFFLFFCISYFHSYSVAGGVTGWLPLTPSSPCSILLILIMSYAKQSTSKGDNISPGNYSKASRPFWKHAWWPICLSVASTAQSCCQGAQELAKWVSIWKSEGMACLRGASLSHSRDEVHQCKDLWDFLGSDLKEMAMPIPSYWRRFLSCPFQQSFSSKETRRGLY